MEVGCNLGDMLHLAGCALTASIKQGDTVEYHPEDAAAFSMPKYGLVVEVGQREDGLPELLHILTPAPYAGRPYRPAFISAASVITVYNAAALKMAS